MARCGTLRCVAVCALLRSVVFDVRRPRARASLSKSTLGASPPPCAAGSARPCPARLLPRALQKYIALATLLFLIVSLARWSGAARGGSGAAAGHRVRAGLCSDKSIETVGGTQANEVIHLSRADQGHPPLGRPATPRHATPGHATPRQAPLRPCHVVSRLDRSRSGQRRAGLRAAAGRGMVVEIRDPGPSPAPPGPAARWQPTGT